MEFSDSFLPKLKSRELLFQMDTEFCQVYIGNCSDSVFSHHEGEQKSSPLRLPSIFILRSSVFSFSFVNQGTHMEHSTNSDKQKACYAAVLR